MAAPELKLNVSLDLGFFRQQLQKLTVVAQSEFAPKLNVKFNKQTLDKELNNLQSAIKRRVYRIEIGGNIDALPEKIKNIRQQLASLETQSKIELPVNIRNGVTKKDATRVIAAAYKTIRTSGLENTGGKIHIPVSIRPAITKADVSAFKKAVKESLGGISVDVKANVRGGGFAGSSQGAAGLMEYMRTQGMVGKTASGMEMRMGNEGGKIQRSALDQLARAVFFMAGIDPARVRAEQVERRRIPDINWQAITPTRAPFAGPSSTGRALPPGITPSSLPGTAFASQKRLVGDILSPSLKDAVRGAANTFVDSIRQGLNDAVRSVRVRDLGNALRPALTGSRVAGLLAPGVGRVSNPYGTGRLGREGETRAELFARREREARMRSALRGVDVMGEGGMASRAASPYNYAHRAARPQGAIVPYAPGGAMVYSGPGGGGGTGGGPGNFAGRGGMSGGSFNVPNLPGAGLVREIGTEFAFAAKQVLLFGTAYRALAFIQGFPAEVGSAVGALQNFRNTLGAISPSAEEAAASSQFILDVVDKYNTPIQSARDGFTKLYASMKPTGFSGEEIRDLFLGISQAAATFGMSADKVDRVNYAFAQMASKGQVMSEELKGQLGDVLPGAMGIFAEAAGFEGPEAITKFSKALEDGAYKGEAMKTLLTNVGVIMRKEFGPGAEGAARTFQGVINRMQNSFKLLYESFEPVAVGFLNSVVMPLTSGIKTVTDGFNAFFTGQVAQTAGGSAFAKQLTDLKPAFEGILANIQALIPSFQIFGGLLLNVAKFLTTLAGNPIVGFLLKVYTNVLLVNTAFTLLGGKILLGAMASINAAIARLVALSVTMNALGVATTKAGTSIAGTQLQMLLLQRSAASAVGPVNALLGSLLRLAGLGVIAITVAIAVNGVNELRDAEMRLARLRGDRDPVGPEGPRPVVTPSRRFTGASRETVQKAREAQAPLLLQYRKELKVLQQQVLTAQAITNASEDNAQASAANVKLRAAQARVEAKLIDIQNAQGILNLNPSKYQTEAERQRASVTALTKIAGGGATGDGKGSKSKAAKERESQIPQLTLALEKTKELSGIEMQIVNAQLMNNTAQLSSLELLKQLVEFKYEAKALALEDLTTEERALKYKEIGLRREQAIFENQLQLQIDLKKERDGIQEGFAATLAGYQEEANFQQMYLDLINQGLLPSLAKARVEAEKAFAEGEKKLDQSIEQIEANIASLDLTIEALKLEKNLTPEKQKQLEADEKRLEILKEDLRLRGFLKGTAPERRGAAIEAAEKGLAPKTAQEYLGEGLEAAQDRLKELTNTGYQVVEAANAIGSAFGEAFKGMITGSMTVQEAFAGMFRSIADHFADMVAQVIAEWMKAQLVQGFMNLFSAALPGLGSFAGGAGIGQSVAMPSSVGMGAGGGILQNSTGQGFGTFGPNFGIRQFANGGMVTGPTLGLVGEGRYNEAIIPLPDGKSVPVQLSGGAGGNAAPINTSIVVNVKNDQAESQMSGNQGNQLARELEGAVRQVILKETRPGGLISGSR